MQKWRAVVLISDGQEDETQHLFDDPTSMHYGSFEQQHMNGQEDPQEVQREIEALQQVVARTSKYVPLLSSVQPWILGIQTPGEHDTAHRVHEGT